MTGALPAGPVRVVIIDLDGTMVDTAGDFHAAINAMLETLGAAPDMPAQEIVGYVGKGSENLVRRVLDARLPPAQANSRFAEALDAYQRAYLAINGRYARVYDGVREGLDALRGMGLALACVTNKPHDFTQPLLAQLGLAPVSTSFIRATPSLSQARSVPHAARGGGLRREPGRHRRHRRFGERCPRRPRCRHARAGGAIRLQPWPACTSGGSRCYSRFAFAAAQLIRPHATSGHTMHRAMSAASN